MPHAVFPQMLQSFLFKFFPSTLSVWMSAMTVLSSYPSRAINLASAILSRVEASQHCSSSAMASTQRRRRSCSSVVRVDGFFLQKHCALAPRDAMRPLFASALHTSDGSVDRNDAASTGPLISPNPQISLEEAVTSQMDALACNDEPRPDHGLVVMYYFANTDGTDSGGSLPQYFGFPSDLYHFGHFALKFKTWYPELINHSGYKVMGVEDVKGTDEGGSAHVTVQARSVNKESSNWIFTMSKHARGQQLPCWLTTSLTRASSGQDSSAAKF